jgi:group I intron endonuclease
MKKIGIYKITNPKGAIYIGQSIDIKSRWCSYRSIDCKKQHKLYRSLKKYGVKNHTFEIVKECLESELNYYERHYQEFYNVLDREFGLNLKLTKVGEKKQVHSEETRKKQSDAQKKLYESGYVNPNKGKKMSEDFCRKNSESKKGKTTWIKGKKHSEASLKKMSDAQKGKKHTDESRKKISENHKCKKEGFVHPLKGKKHSEEHKRKIRENSPKSKKVINIETNEVYNSIGEICMVLGLKNSTISMKLTGTRKNNTPFRHLD